MSTSGGGWLNAGLFVLVIALCVQVAAVRLGGRRPALAPAAIGLWLVVAVPSLLQIPWPGLLTALRRDPDLIRRHGQVWRVLTSVLVQDGGLGGTAFNLAILAVVGMVAVTVWGPVPASVIFLLGHLVFNLSATFLSTEVGAGNSAATLALAASITTASIGNRTFSAGTVGPGAVRRRSLPPGLRLRAAGVLAAGLVLVAIGDAHGIAVLAGLLIGAGFAVAG